MALRLATVFTRPSTRANGDWQGSGEIQKGKEASSWPLALRPVALMTHYRRCLQRSTKRNGALIVGAIGGNPVLACLDMPQLACRPVWDGLGD